MKNLKISKVLSALVVIFAALAVMNSAKVNAVNSAVPNDVWCGTFQLVWNDLMDKIVKGPVEFVGGNPPLANELNKQNFKSDMISKDSYYKVCDEKSPALKRRIERAIWFKFHEKSDILDKFDWTKSKDSFFIYAMLKKDFKFEKPFDILQSTPFNGSKESVKFFGINSKSNNELRNTVKVLFYKNQEEYAVALSDKKGKEEIILYRTDSKQPFETLFKSIESSSKPSKMEDIDKLKVPFVKIDKEISYDELCNREIKNTDKLYIAKALQTIKFSMDNEGAKLKSEAAMDIMKMSMPINPPRYFNFDKPFVLFMKETNKTKPYFALRVEDTKYLVK